MDEISDKNNFDYHLRLHLSMEWEKYKAQEYDASIGWHNECKPLTTVFHVAHVETAIRIVKDGRLKAGLVFDKSKLNRERILVNWLSPNEWSNGSRYGNIAFEKDFQQLIENKKYYWIEVMTEYNVHALRILITPYEYPDLTPYNPIKDHGPWRFDEEHQIHYWNPTHCLEFMHEGDLMVDQFTAIKYVDHHKHYCCIDHKTCPDMDLYRPIARSRFIARLMAENIKPFRPHFTISEENGIETNEDLQAAIGHIFMRIVQAKNYPEGDIAFNDPLASLYMQALLLFYGLKQYDEFKSFVLLFKSQDDFRGALTLKAADTFGLTSTDHLNWPI